MKRFKILCSLLLLLSLGLTACSGEKKVTWEANPVGESKPAIIPLPSTVNWGDQLFQVPVDNTICYTEGTATAAKWLEELLDRAGLSSETSTGDNCGSWNLVKKAELKDQLGEEGYILDITSEGVTLQSATDAGFFYGIQTLRQLLPASMEEGRLTGADIFLRETHIEDVPHYSWRGTMVDVARSFFNLEYLKKHVDRMAAYKLNRLHLHLTDDQGWRIEIKSWPKLTEIGSESAVTDGEYGYLTQEEYKELQAYAADRNIVIIPEIDMPGHIYAALRSYPEELNCPDESNINPKKAELPEPYTGYNVGWSKLCLENPAIYDFVSDVVGEIAGITTGPWFHMGGDEIEDPRYEEFVIKADSIVQETGKITIGWEEVTKAEVSDNVISQQWHGKVDSKIDGNVILSLCSSFYLDHANVTGQEHTNNWCKADGVSLEDVYTFSSDNPKALGVEAAVWTEYVVNEDMLDDRFWPRSIAVAEVGWTAPEDRDFKDFQQRLGQQASRLNATGVNYYPTPEIEWNRDDLAEEANSVFAGFAPEE